MGNPMNPNASRTLWTKLVAICAETSSRRGMVRFFLANRDFAATRPCDVPLACRTTAITVAATPFPLASPNVCNSISLMASWCFARVRGPHVIWKIIFPGRPSNFQLIWTFVVPRELGVATIPVEEFSLQCHWCDQSEGIVDFRYFTEYSSFGCLCFSGRYLDFYDVIFLVPGKTE